jgi:hypothetical protein
MPAEVERFLQETEEYINKLTKKLVQYKAEEQAGEAVQEAITEVCVSQLGLLFCGSWRAEPRLCMCVRVRLDDSGIACIWCNCWRARASAFGYALELVVAARCMY